MNEFTGTYGHCYDCGHTWDWDDDACPNCGSKDNIDGMTAGEIRTIYAYGPSDKFLEISKMLSKHGD